MTSLSSAGSRSTSASLSSSSSRATPLLELGSELARSASARAASRSSRALRHSSASLYGAFELLQPPAAPRPPRGGRCRRQGRDSRSCASRVGALELVDELVDSGHRAIDCRGEALPGPRRRRVAPERCSPVYLGRRLATNGAIALRASRPLCRPSRPATPSSTSSRLDVISGRRRAPPRPGSSPSPPRPARESRRVDPGDASPDRERDPLIPSPGWKVTVADVVEPLGRRAGLAQGRPRAPSRSTHA